jgi:hypothetical protein
MASSLSRGGHKELGEGAGRSSYPTTSKGSCCASQQICLPMTEMGQERPNCDGRGMSASRPKATESRHFTK